MCWRSRVLRGLFCRSLLQELRKSCWLHPHYWQTRSTFITFWKEASANHFFLFEGFFEDLPVNQLLLNVRLSPLHLLDVLVQVLLLVALLHQDLLSDFELRLSGGEKILHAFNLVPHLLNLLFSDCSDVGGNLHLLLFLLCHEESLLRAEILLGHRHVGHVALHRLALAPM